MMKLTAFQSDKGDCLLLESADGKKRMLIDGGMKRAYSAHVASAMGALRSANKQLDLLYISHIDEDHIAGALQLLDDEAEWRVHEHQKNNGNRDHPKPKVARPPRVGAVFHNSFHDQLGKNTGAIEDMLAATSTILSGSDHPWLRKIAEDRRNLVTSIPQAMKVSHRIKTGQLNIPLNPQFSGKLMMVNENVPKITLGSIKLIVIGPFPEDLRILREKWKEWLRDNQEQVRTIRAQAKNDERSMTANQVDRLLAPLLGATDKLGAIELALAKKLGDRKKVTAPNLASLMFLAEENGTRILLTGDGHSEEVLKGLEHHHLLDANERIHVNVLKVQHHGSEHNIEKRFCDSVSADDYVFCGNGQHENPDLDVLELVFERRMANDKKPFKFWFNSSSKLTINDDGRAHMHEVENRVAKLAAKSKNRLKNRFINGNSIRII
jgi:beta-lactamase superfamily II metal-dependent hydrolase